MSSDNFRHFGGMCWPVPGEGLDSINWSLRYDGKATSGHLVAASVIEAYSELIRLPAKKRDAIIRELRKGPWRSEG